MDTGRLSDCFPLCSTFSSKQLLSRGNFFAHVDRDLNEESEPITVGLLSATLGAA